MSPRLPLPRTPGRRRWGIAVAILLGVTLGFGGPITASAAKGPGAPSIGDDYFPKTGNGGYDVLRYGLNIDYRPDTDMLTGTAVITAKATQALTSFTLDLFGLEVSAVTVNGLRATWDQGVIATTWDGGDTKLVITPKRSLRAGVPFVATIRYSGVPQRIITTVSGAEGLLATEDGAIAVGKPWGASGWFPINDHPSDKALYSVRITVPKGMEAISNGRLLWQRDTADSSIWFWNMDKPMASYLATAVIGQYDISTSQVDGIQYVNAIERDLATPEIVPHSGTDFAFSGQEDYTYKRLARAMTIPADDPRLSFWIDHDTEPGLSFVFVEILPEDGIWRTLPDEDGILKQDSGRLFCEDTLTYMAFLKNYLTYEEYEDCDATGFWAVSGDSEGWDQWTFDLSEYTGQDVYISITYMSEGWGEGVGIDDIDAPGGVGSTSFDDPGNVMHGWTIPGAPEGTGFGGVDWRVGDYSPLRTRDGYYGRPVAGVPPDASLARQPQIVAFLEQSFGPYPFDDFGGIVTDDAWYSVENQTRPIYPRPDSDVMVNRIAHQWFGNSLTPERWRDIWLSEGFATYAEWLWHNVDDTQASFDQAVAERRGWGGIGDPGRDAVISGREPENPTAIAVSVRGAMTLHALRETVGDEVFFDLLRTWTADNAHGNVTTAEFIQLAEQLSGQDLGAFFDMWLYTGGLPARVPAAD